MQVVDEDTPTPYLLGKPPTGRGHGSCGVPALAVAHDGRQESDAGAFALGEGPVHDRRGVCSDRIPALGTPVPDRGAEVTADALRADGDRGRKSPDHIGIGLVPLAEEWTGTGGERFDTTPPPIGEESNLTFDAISPGRRALLTTRRAFPTSEARPMYSHEVAGSISTLLRCSDRGNSVKGGHENSTRPVTERDARRPGARGRVRCRRSAVPAHGDAERCPRALSETRTAPSCTLRPFTPTPKPLSEPGTGSRATAARPPGAVAATGDGESPRSGWAVAVETEALTAVGQPARRPSFVERRVRGSRRPRCSRSVVPVYSVR